MTFLATLGLSEVEFYTVRERYIRSVARAADVGPSAVETGEVHLPPLDPDANRTCSSRVECDHSLRSLRFPL